MCAHMHGRDGGLQEDTTVKNGSSYHKVDDGICSQRCVLHRQGLRPIHWNSITIRFDVVD